MGRKKKMLVGLISMFSFAHNVFKRLLSQGWDNRGLFGVQSVQGWMLISYVALLYN